MTAQQVQAEGPAAPAGRARPANPPVAVRALDVLASEWIKLRSVRSNYLTTLIAAIVTIGGTVLVAFAVTGDSPSQMSEGNVTSVPPPAIELMPPARNADPAATAI